MTSEQKIKDLMSRVVAMTPEPPPFPEESEMTRQPVQPRRSPAVILAVAAAAIIALVLPLILFQGGGEEPAVTTAPTPTTMGPPQTTLPVVTSFQGVVYLVADPENSFTGDPALVAVNVALVDETGLLRGIEDPALVLTRLADLGANLPEGLATVIPAGVDGVDGGVDASGVITMYMNDRFLEGAGGLEADITMLNQIIYTVTYGREEALVKFIVDDQPVGAYGTEGLSLVDPVGRDTFLDELNLILVTQPLNFGGDGLPQIEGRANVFEAGLTVRITDPETGETLYEEAVMATSGTGTWGDYAHSFDTPLLTEDTVVEVFWYSAEDGEPANVVRVPVLAEPIDLNP